MTQPIRIFRACALIALTAGLGTGLGVSVSQAADTAAAPPAHWVERTLDYTYFGFTTHYSCDGLESSVRRVLLALGARKSDLKIRTQGCTRLEGPEPFPGVLAHFWVLEPLQPNETAKVGEPPAQATRWQSVDLLTTRGFLDDQGECELLEQMKVKALPLFASRNLDFSATCTPHEIDLGDIRFKVDVLRPAPATGTAPAA